MLLSLADNPIPECACDHQGEDGSLHPQRHPTLHHLREVWLLFARQQGCHLQRHLQMLAKQYLEFCEWVMCVVIYDLDNPGVCVGRGVCVLYIIMELLHDHVTFE